ncbi:hypothetical protein D3C73_1299080 [compost metagenome]
MGSFIVENVSLQTQIGTLADAYLRFLSNFEELMGTVDGSFYTFKLKRNISSNNTKWLSNISSAVNLMPGASSPILDSKVILIPPQTWWIAEVRLIEG